MADQTVKTLMGLAARRFGKSESVLNAGDDFFEALGIDSLQAMDLLTELEDAFDVEVPDYELQGVKTFEELADVIRRRI